MADEFKDTPVDSFQSTPDDAWVAAEAAPVAAEDIISSTTKVVVRFVSPDTITHPFNHFF